MFLDKCEYCDTTYITKTSRKSFITWMNKYETLKRNH